MEVDLSIQSEASANENMDAIKQFSPFNEYLLGERLGLFGEDGTGTQIYIWNLDTWGSVYSLKWMEGARTAEGLLESDGDILIRSRRLRSRPGQISLEVAFTYYLTISWFILHHLVIVYILLVRCKSSNLLVQADLLLISACLAV